MRKSGESSNAQYINDDDLSKIHPQLTWFGVIPDVGMNSSTPTYERAVGISEVDMVRLRTTIPRMRLGWSMRDMQQLSVDLKYDHRTSSGNKVGTGIAA